jgi:hypothetical protein
VTELDLPGDYDPPIMPAEADEEPDMDTEGMGPDEDDDAPLA